MPEIPDIPEQKTNEEAAADSTAQESTTPQLEIQATDMEVHHHPDLHHKSKPLKEYLLEFLMIFLAVTLGFFAETFREHISENAKAGELAESLYKEAYSDSVDIQNRLMVRRRKEEELDYFIAYVRDSSLTNVSDRFYRSFTWTGLVTSTIQFEPADGMLNQLRNSGSLRYFKDNTIQREIGELSVSIAKVRNRMEFEIGFMTGEIRPFVIRFYDFKWNDELTQHGKINLLLALNNQPAPRHKGEILNARNFNRLEAENLASYFRILLKATRTLQLDSYTEINHKLLETLRQNYHIE